MAIDQNSGMGNKGTMPGQHDDVKGQPAKSPQADRGGMSGDANTTSGSKPASTSGNSGGNR
ncbi:MAG: hypothetical protein K2Q12_06785 [Rickettsiales bacterium]|nr:hypothetical protein [Rickettsiales bacterium]